MAAEYLTIYDDTTFQAIWPLTNDDGTPLETAGWTAVAQIRDEATGVLRATFVVQLADGSVTLKLAPAVRSPVWREGVFDVLLIAPDTDQSRPISGYVTTEKTVSRAAG